VQRVAPAGATTASGYQGTYDLTVTGRGPPAERWSRPWRRDRPRCEPAGGNGGCPGKPGRGVRSTRPWTRPRGTAAGWRRQRHPLARPPPLQGSTVPAAGPPVAGVSPSGRR